VAVPEQPRAKSACPAPQYAALPCRWAGQAQGTEGTKKSKKKSGAPEKGAGVLLRQAGTAPRVYVWYSNRRCGIFARTY